MLAEVFFFVYLQPTSTGHRLVYRHFEEKAEAPPAGPPNLRQQRSGARRRPGRTRQICDGPLAADRLTIDKGQAAVLQSGSPAGEGLGRRQEKIANLQGSAWCLRSIANLPSMASTGAVIFQNRSEGLETNEDRTDALGGL